MAWFGNGPRVYLQACTWVSERAQGVHAHLHDGEAVLQVSVKRLDALLVRLVSLDVLIELLHVCVKASRAECLLREPRCAHGANREHHIHTDGDGRGRSATRGRKQRTSRFGSISDCSY